MHSLRFDGETDGDFRSRVEKVGLYAKVLTEACLANKCMQEFIADPELPLITADSVRRNPNVRIEYEQAIAIGGVGETLRATKNKHWGEGPWITPLQVDDEFFAARITYFIRENSLYNRRFL